MALAIFCDESGFTGPNLFLDPQRYFVYSSVAMPHEQAVEVVAKMRVDYRIKTNELKYERLSKSPTGITAVRWLLETYGDRMAVFYADKKFASAGKFFEYTFEPVLRPLRDLFYGIGFHRFVSNLLFDAWEEGDQVAHELIEDGQNLIRYKKPEELKRLLREPLYLPEGDDPLTAIAAFCFAYRRGILREIDVIGSDVELSRWSMDISDTALLMTYYHWGAKGDELEVYCDDSKPLRASASHLHAMATSDQSEWFEISILQHRKPVRMAKPVQFVDSKGTMVGIQLADVLAGACRHMLSAPEEPDAAQWKSLIYPRFVSGCVFPDQRYIHTERRDTELNLMVLKELDDRARRGLDPLFRMNVMIATMAEMVAETVEVEEE